MYAFQLAILLWITCKQSRGQRYEPTWKSLDSRPLPPWFDKAKFGIFMHWGLYSVAGARNVTKEKDLVQRLYGRPFQLPQLANEFHARMFNASKFVQVVKRSGARYFVFTTKHHDGFALWNTKHSLHWNTLSNSAHRDIVSELHQAFREEAPEVHFGLYYSLLEYDNPLFKSDKRNRFYTQDFIKAVITPQLHDLVEQFKPDIVWSDGDWDAHYTYWNSRQFLAWLYNDSPVRDTVVTNDRWGVPGLCRHGGYLTCKDYFQPEELQRRKWENCMTIDRVAWAFRRDLRISDVLTTSELIQTLIKTVSTGGNLLMNVAPTVDGIIDPIYEERLLSVGEWLDLNGEAIFDTKPWIYQKDPANSNVWYTSKLTRNGHLNEGRMFNPQIINDTIVYALLSEWPTTGRLLLRAPSITEHTMVTLVGSRAPVTFMKASGPLTGMIVDLSRVSYHHIRNHWAWVLRLQNLGSYNKNPLRDEMKLMRCVYTLCVAILMHRITRRWTKKRTSSTNSNHDNQKPD